MNEFELLIKDITLYSSSKLLSFNSKLVNSKFDMIGLSIPHIKKIAAKYKDLEFHETFWDRNLETNLILFIIWTNQLNNLNDQLAFIEKNGNHLDTWMMTDLLRQYLKLSKSKKDLSILKIYRKSNHEYVRRLVYVSLLCEIKFIKSKDLISFIKFDSSLNVTKGQAWILSMIFSNDSTCLNDIYSKFKNNKKLLKLTNQKIRKSRQISKENKELASKIFLSLLSVQ